MVMRRVVFDHKLIYEFVAAPTTGAPAGPVMYVLNTRASNMAHLERTEER